MGDETGGHFDIFGRNHRGSDLSGNHSQDSDQKASNQYSRQSVTNKPNNNDAADQDEEEEEEDKTVCIFKAEYHIFTFRGKHIPVGQYEFPFTFTLPDKLPSSFQYVNPEGDSFQIKYSIQVYLDDEEPLLECE